MLYVFVDKIVFLLFYVDSPSVGLAVHFFCNFCSIIRKDKLRCSIRAVREKMTPSIKTSVREK